MVEINLGDSAQSVRSKLGMEDIDYHTAWRAINNKAQDICLARYGTKPLKEVNATEAIDELKDYYNLNRDGNQKLVEILQVKGAAAWIVHNAVKRNYDKHRKANKPQTSTPKDDGSSGKPMYDPFGNV